MWIKSLLGKIILLITLCLLTAFPIRAQHGDINIHFNDREQTVRSILTEVSKQRSIHFSYDDRLPLDAKISFDSENILLSDILRKIKTVTGFSHKTVGNKILFISPRKKHVISGYLRDAQTGESLIGGNIYVMPDMTGNATNTFGYFSLALLPDSVSLTFSYVGYETKRTKFFFDQDTVINISLNPQVLQEVVISGEESSHEMTRMSSIEVPVQQIKSLPAMAGEVDVMKSLQLLPGVQAGAEGSSGFYVRGGSPDQNLILLDGVPVYNASHLFGFFSVFNADAINHVELIKGGFPARFGGRLSSVVNINLKEGNQERIKGEGSVGLISSRLTIDGPIKKGKSSFIISARRTFADVLVRPFLHWHSGGKNDQDYFFYDLSAKFNHRINKNNRLYLSVYAGSDKVSRRSKSAFNSDTLKIAKGDSYMLAWGNATTALRWNSVLNPKLFSNLTATFSQYKFNTTTESSERIASEDFNVDSHYKNKYVSGIRDFAIRDDIDFLPDVNHTIKTGFYAIQHTFSPGALTYQVGVSKDTVVGSYEIKAFEYGGYAEDDVAISPRTKINLGFHWAGFHVEDKTYASVQPRFALRYLLSGKTALKISYVKMRQFIHLLTNAGIGLPTDLWVPATAIAKPEDSWQAAMGLSYRPDSNFEFSIEGYYKAMTGLIEYKNGASFLNLDKDWQSKIEVGNGRSYGSEFFMKKNTGKVTGWIGYTLAWANRQFDNIDNGKRFPFKYDRRHDLEVALIYAWNKKIDFACTWVYGSGLPTTLPTVRYNDYSGGIPATQIGDRYVQYYPGRNNYRMRDYHRLDVTISFYKKKKWGERRWVFGLYNAYNRRNPFYLGVKKSNSNDSPKIIQYSLFPVIPAISYNFKF
jgi:hypothetical protein